MQEPGYETKCEQTLQVRGALAVTIIQDPGVVAQDSRPRIVGLVALKLTSATSTNHPHSNNLSESYLMPSRASDAGASAQGQLPWLAVIPPEILSLILSSLTNRDRKSLRLTCKVFEEITPLCLSRVFLSTNPLDIEVLHAVADHPKYRQQVTEIIWDDARFITTPPLSEDEWYAMIERGIQTRRPRPPKIDPEYNCPRWFVKECKKNIDFMGHRPGSSPSHRMAETG